MYFFFIFFFTLTSCYSPLTKIHLLWIRRVIVHSYCRYSGDQQRRERIHLTTPNIPSTSNSCSPYLVAIIRFISCLLLYSVEGNSGRSYNYLYWSVWLWGSFDEFVCLQLILIFEKNLKISMWNKISCSNFHILITWVLQWETWLPVQTERAVLVEPRNHNICHKSTSFVCSFFFIFRLFTFIMDT